MSPSQSSSMSSTPLLSACLALSSMNARGAVWRRRVEVEECRDDDGKLAHQVAHDHLGGLVQLAFGKEQQAAPRRTAVVSRMVIGPRRTHVQAAPAAQKRADEAFKAIRPRRQRRQRTPVMWMQSGRSTT